MNPKSLSRIRSLAFGLLILLGANCSTAPKTGEEPAVPRAKWYAHCESCNWCKGSFRTSQEAQEIVSNHNKALHDWYKVAYYDLVKCP